MLDQPDHEAQQSRSNESPTPTESTPSVGGDTESATPPSSPRKRVRVRDQSDTARASRMAAMGLTLGSLPKGRAWVERTVKRLQPVLEAMVLDRLGVLGDFELMAIHTALTAERWAIDAQRELRRRTEAAEAEGKQISLEHYVLLNREIIKAREARDRAILRLGVQPSHVDDARSNMPTLPEGYVLTTPATPRDECNSPSTDQ